MIFDTQFAMLKLIKNSICDAALHSDKSLKQLVVNSKEYLNDMKTF